MLKKVLCLALCLLIALDLVPAMAEEVWVPDPYTLLGAEGTFQETMEGLDGKNYHYYAYAPVKTADEMKKAMARYEVAMKNQGFDVYTPEIQTEFGLLYLVFVNDSRDVVEIIFDAAEEVDYLNLDAEGDILWDFRMYVPESVSFTLGRGVPGVTQDGQDICKLCNGAGKCTGCSGHGGYYIGKIYHTCGSCNGNRLCSICGGAGVYID